MRMKVQIVSFWERVHTVSAWPYMYVCTKYVLFAWFMATADLQVIVLLAVHGMCAYCTVRGRVKGAAHSVLVVKHSSSTIVVLSLNNHDDVSFTLSILLPHRC